MFDDKAFMKNAFHAREKDVSVPELKAFFEKDTKALWKVRGMTGSEIAMVNSARDKQDNMIAAIEAMSGNNQADKIDAFKELLGVGTGEVPGDIIRRKEMLVSCSIRPICSEELAIKLATTFPQIFFALTNEILRLTGLGQVPGKQKPSGQKQESKTAS